MNRLLIALALVTTMSALGCDKSSEKKATKTDDTEEDDSKSSSSSKSKSSKSKSGAIDRSLTKSYAGDEAGATALIKAFIDKKTDKVALTKALRPDSDDFKAIFIGDAAAKAEEGYKKMWDAPEFQGIGGKEDQTETLIFKVSTEDIAAWNENAKTLPGGYEKVKDKFQKGLTVYRFKFVKSGETLGMANDGLIHVNGHWVFVPKPWKSLGE